MKRRCRMLVYTLGIAIATAAIAAPTRITSFESFFGESPSANGMAILNYSQHQDSVVGQVILSDLVPSAEYVVLVREPGSWCLDEATAVYPIAAFDPSTSGAHTFTISAENQLTGPTGNLTFHATTTSGSGDNTNNDVIIVLQNEWNQRTTNPGDGTLRVRVRLVGTSGTVFACP